VLSVRHYSTLTANVFPGGGKVNAAILLGCGTTATSIKTAPDHGPSSVDTNPVYAVGVLGYGNRTVKGTAFAALHLFPFCIVGSNILLI
jgi:hypothetical protein